MVRKHSYVDRFRPGYDAFDPDDAAAMYNMARSGMMRGAAMRRFDEYFRCYPMVMAPGSERPELNYGSKIFLPPSALQKISQLHVQWPLMMELVNGEKDRYTHAGVLEFVAEEGRAYLPQWLDVGDMIQIKSTSLELAKMVRLQPQHTNFLNISDPKAVLEKVFRNFATLTKGDVFNFEYNDEVYEVAVLEVKPETEKMGVCMIETDVSVDFAPPVGYVEPTKTSGTSTPRSTRGGLPAGGLVHNQGTMAQSINYDAIAPNATAAAAGARAVSSHFTSEGHRLNARKGSKAPTPKPSTPVAGTSTNQVPVPPRRTNGPMPLRLPPNKLFFGYEVKPVKTDADREAEKENVNRPHFAGQGQTLRGVVKKKGEADDKDKGKAPAEKKPGEGGRRLDGLQDIYNLFEFDPNFEYEHILGQGRNGVACVLRERKDGQFCRRIVVKRPTTKDPFIIDKVRKELQILKVLWGAPHIVRPLVLDDFPPDEDDPSELIGQLFEGPILITEHLGSGSSKRFINRASKLGYQIPNRVLWRVFLCFVFGDLDLVAWSIEHKMMPMLKMIDFGSAEKFGFGSQELKDRLASHPNEGNVFDIGRLMYNIITKQTGATLLPYGDPHDEDKTVKVDLDDSPSMSFKSFAKALYPSADIAQPYPSLDGKLRLLIARCVCAKDAAQHQPSVRELLDAADDAVRNRGADFYANNNQNETDANVVGIVQDLMLDADVDPAMLPYEHLEPDPIRFKPGVGFADDEEGVDDHLEPDHIGFKPGAGFADVEGPPIDDHNSDSSDSEQEHIFPLII
ncbi:hypothetical protein DL764_007521 [Monosporascus ibericus]|uniref:Protein kinase domain-containing protein n=1 Tax=Monosporascus ibericus TaxID=155417 RepID=A0A4Q4T3L5_9PEZI|nr:hypothetical protein DL764_007521 [Monosporascus ibericus]